MSHKREFTNTEKETIVELYKTLGTVAIGKRFKAGYVAINRVLSEYNIVLKKQGGTKAGGKKYGFGDGSVPWNKNLKGIHLSPKSEFKKGMIPWNKIDKDAAPDVDGHKARKRNQTPPMNELEKSKMRDIELLARHLGKDWHVDHIKPLVLFGLNHPNNLQVIPAAHNLRKGSKENYIVPEDVSFTHDKIKQLQCNIDILSVGGWFGGAI